MTITPSATITENHLVAINGIFEMAREQVDADKFEQERSWIQHLVNIGEDGQEVYTEACVVFNYLELLGWR